MAITTAKVTYSLKPDTVHRVQELSTAWGVPKSEVINRVINQAAAREPFSPILTPLQALEELRSSIGMSAKMAGQFEREIRLSRRASGRHRE